MNKICYIQECSQYKQKNTSFHRFPADKKLCKSWCKSIKTLNDQPNAKTFHKTSSYVCGHHFTKEDKYSSGKKTMLYKHAIPSIFPRHCQVEESSNAPNETEKESIDTSKEANPVAEENNSIEPSTCERSDQEDFLGFDPVDLNKIKNNANNETDDIDDEIIFVENNVEVIEIDDDDDDDNNIPPTPIVQIKKEKKFSREEIQQMVIDNHPQIELRKPELDWKSDQFRLIYINGENQNLCTCTKCCELFEEINIDNVVKHAKCNPAPTLSSGAKRRKLNDLLQAVMQGSEGSSPVQQNITVSKIQTLAACMDVQTSTFYQRKRFLSFAQFLIDAGAAANASSGHKNKFIHEPKYDVMCSFRDQLKDTRHTKMLSILNDPAVDFTLSCEVWEDILRGKTNVSLDLHYLDGNFLRHRLVIGVRSINDIDVDDPIICNQVLEILRIYSPKVSSAEILQRATAFVTSRKLDTQLLGTGTNFTSACSTINEVATQIINEDKLNIGEKCLQVIGWLNAVSTEKIVKFDARKWENIFELYKKFSITKATFIQREIETTFPQDYAILQLLEPFHNAIVRLSESQNNITKVFAIYKSLETSLTPGACDIEIVKFAKKKALASLTAAFADSDVYQICMFLDPSNRDQYNSLESEKMDTLQSKIDLMINPYMSSTKENGCVENDLIHYMDDNVTSQQHQIDLFLQWHIPSKDDPYEFWRDNEQMPGLKALARKYFTIPTYVSLAECKFTNSAKEFLTKRNTLEIKDMETMLMMNSSQLDVEQMNLNKIN